MKEIRIVIISETSNSVKEFKGEDYIKDAAIFLAKLGGFTLFEATSEPAISIDKPVEVIKEDVAIKASRKKGIVGKIKNALK